MSIEQYRERVTARVMQSIRQSGVDLSMLSAEQQNRLVHTISDGMLLEFDALLDELVLDLDAQKPAAAAPLQEEMPGLHEEQVLWHGRPFLSLVESYTVTTDRVRIFHGLLSKSVENIELVRLQDVDYTQGVGERMLNIGDVKLHSADPSNPESVLRNVSDPEKVQELIRRAWLDARRRHGVRFREEM